jgi:streptogramin lyase
MEADTDNYNCTMGTCEGLAWGGTSFAAPRWAGFAALMNQQAADAGNLPVGFINPAIYSIGTGSSYAADFHDTASGNNDCCGLPLYYLAVEGYDLVTGWGSPNGQNLIDALAGAPATGFTLTNSALTASLSINQGSSGTAVITVNDQGGFTGSVSLAVSGLPSGVSASFSPSSTTGSSTLYLTAASSAIPGTVYVTITGTSGAATASTTFALTIVAPSFTLSVPPLSLLINNPSVPVTTTVTVNDQDGFTGSVNLEVSGLPSGMTASFSPNSMTGSSVLSLSANGTITIGGFYLTITGTSGSLTESTFQYVIVEIPGFSLAASPNSLTISPGAPGASTITLNPYNGFTGSANLTVSGLPGGVTASFAPNPTTAMSVLTLTASGSTNPSVYPPLTVTGTYTAGLQSATTTIALTVGPSGSVLSGANFGTMNIGSTSLVQTLTYSFGTAVTLGSTAVLTGGATGLDFADAGTGTCTANTSYTAGQSCTVNVTFTPKFAGARDGAVVLANNSGGVIAAGYLQGTGMGPQVNFLPNTESMVASAGLYDPYGVAVDGSGNVYIADSSNNRILKETLAGGAYNQSTIPTSSLYTPNDLAVDGSGNIYISDTNNYRVLKETPTAGGYAESTIADLSSDEIQPYGIAIDGSGNVYFSTPFGTLYVETLSAGTYTQSTIQTGSSRIGDLSVDARGDIYITDIANDRVLVEAPSANGYTQSTLPTSGLGTPWGIAVDGNGNVYITGVGNNTVLKEMSSAGGYSQSTISTSALDGPFGVAVDGSGNVYVADSGDFRILKEDFADAPSLSFAPTNPGSTSSDSPQTVTVENVGGLAPIFDTTG